MDLRTENERLRKENQRLAEALAATQEALRQVSDRLREVEAQLGQDSHNSHWPSSRDKGKRQTKSLRKTSGKQAGGQAGHTGATLTLQPEADRVVAHGRRHAPDVNLHT